MRKDREQLMFPRPRTEVEPHLKARWRIPGFYFAFFLLFPITAATQTTPLCKSGSGTLGNSGAVGEKDVLTLEKLLADYSSFTPLPSARWLPNSKQVIFSLKDRNQTGVETKTWVVIADIDSGECKRLTEGSNAEPSPDGLSIAYVIGKKETTQLWVMSIQGGQARTLAQVSGPLGASDFHWSPDSQKIVYLAREQENVQLQVTSVLEEESRSLAQLPADVAAINFSWSPDSQKIAYSYRPAPAKSEQTDGKSSSVVVIGGEGDVPADSEIWVVDIDTQSREKLTSGPYAVGHLSWFPDGRTLLFTATVWFEYRYGNPSQEIRSISIPKGTVRTILKEGGMHLEPSLSPDGRQIAFTYEPNNLVYPFDLRVATVRSHGGSVQQLTHNIFMWWGVTWSPDGYGIYFRCKDGALWQICLATTEGEFKQLTRSPREASGLAVSPDGRYLAWTTQDAQGRVEIRVAGSDGTGERVLADLAPEVKTFDLGEVEEIRWKSRDGLEIAGLLIRPVGYEPGKKYPLLVDIHGGPQTGIYLRGSILLTSPLEWHLWATKGFVVLIPDYRSSQVYGWDQILQARERQDSHDRDFDDIMSGVDHVIKMGMVDPNKLALSGHSYGAILINWIITRTHRFKVAVSKEGAIEMYLAYGTGRRVGGNTTMEWLFQGKPWEVPENYRANSAIENLKGVKTPTLLISGDRGIPLYHNEFLYTALRKQGVDTKLLVYKGEGHAIQRPENLRDLLIRVLGWIDLHLQ